MSAPAPQWHDLRERVLTGLVLVAAGFAVVALGGWVFTVAAALICGVMIWELAVMVHPERGREAVLTGALAAAAIASAHLTGLFPGSLVVLVPALAGVVLLRRHPALFFVYALGITVAALGLTVYRDTYGGLWLFWLVITVAMTDIAGYFGGRMIGGAKFWPAISPKKTWAGIVSGWAVAVVIALIFLAITDAGRDLIWISVLLSFASQMGDIAESAAKRRLGVKDSSSLLPGHGGLFDRFDGLLGASLFMLLTALVVDVPELRF